MLYIEDEGLSPRNLSPVLLDLGKGHKSEGDIEAPPTPSQVGLEYYWGKFPENGILHRKYEFFPNLVIFCPILCFS